MFLFINGGNVRRFAVGLLLTILTLGLVGCSPFVDADQLQQTTDNGVLLSSVAPVGQTFVARHGGLNGLDIWLAPISPVKGNLTLHLRSEPQATQDLVTATLSLAGVVAPGFHHFSFPTARDSHGEYYYAFLTLDGEGALPVGHAPGATYLDGAAYVSHEPQDAQLAFRLTYDLLWMAADLVGAAVRGVGLMLVSVLLYVVPGWALLAWLWPGEKLVWPERLGLAIGISLALYPLLLLWTDLVGLHLGALYAWLPVAGGLAALVWRYRDWRPRQGWETLRCWARSEAVWPDVTLLIVLALVFGVRLLVVRTLDAPMWGDSYQHTMIAQLLVDNGGLFDSWEPYAPLQSFTYHYGFHTVVAVFNWLTGIEILSAVIWVGQLLNGLAVLALYPLALRVSGGRRWAGVLAVMLAGLFSPMPMYYVNWGRYTQLTGQVILPAAVWLSCRIFESEHRDWGLLLLGWLTVGGLALAHYRVLIFYVFFVLAWLLVTLRRSNWRQSLAHVTLVGLGGAVLFLPWFIHAFAGQILMNFGQQLTTGASQVSSFTQQYNSIGNLAIYLPVVGWLLLPLAVAVGLWQKKRGVLLVALWWFLLLIATNPTWVRLPGSGAISNFALFIAAYVPFGILVGSWIGSESALVVTRQKRGVLLALLIIGVGAYGARMRLRDIHIAPHALITRPDMRAMQWIKEDTPEDAKFLVNSFFAYGGSVIVGSDGGWWLPVLAERGNTVPPLNYGTEQGPGVEYRLQINEVWRQIQEKGVEAPETLALLAQRNIRYLYIGQQQGRVNYTGPSVLDPERLVNSAVYQPVYHRDRVWVFEVLLSQ